MVAGRELEESVSSYKPAPVDISVVERPDGGVTISERRPVLRNKGSLATRSGLDIADLTGRVVELVKGTAPGKGLWWDKAFSSLSADIDVELPGDNYAGRLSREAIFDAIKDAAKLRMEALNIPDVQRQQEADTKLHKLCVKANPSLTLDDVRCMMDKAVVDTILEVSLNPRISGHTR